MELILSPGTQLITAVCKKCYDGDCREHMGLRGRLLTQSREDFLRK
jgi:hypothetical protein